MSIKAFTFPKGRVTLLAAFASGLNTI